MYTYDSIRNYKIYNTRYCTDVVWVFILSGTEINR
jgi:hypothetical protein